MKRGKKNTTWIGGSDDLAYETFDMQGPLFFTTLANILKEFSHVMIIIKKIEDFLFNFLCMLRKNNSMIRRKDIKNIWTLEQFFFLF